MILDRSRARTPFGSAQGRLTRTRYFRSIIHKAAYSCNMPPPSLPFVVLDTETTGFVPKVHRVIEFASAEVREGKIKEEYEQLFFHADVPPVVQVLTRIRTADLNGKPPLAEHREDILRHLPEDELLVGKNIPFD